MKGWAKYLLISASLLFLPLRAEGQGMFGFGVGTGEAGISLRGSERDVAAGIGSSSDSDYAQWVRMPVAGYFIDPRIFYYSLVMQPNWRQQVSSIEEGPSRTRNLGFDFSAGLLRTQPVTMTFSAMRNGGVTSGQLGGRGEFELSGVNAGLYLRSRYLPISLEYQSRGATDAWDYGPSRGEPTRRDDLTRTFRFSLRNSKLTAAVDRVGYVDRTGTQDFTSLNSSVVHNLRWGKGSYLQTYLSGMNREGYGAYRRYAWEERVHLQHTERVSSDHHYDQQYSEFSRLPATSRSYGSGIRVRVAQGVDVGVRAAGQTYRRGIDDVTLSNYSVRPDLVFRFSLPYRSSLAGSVSAGFQRNDQPGTSVLRDVIDERHTVPTIRSFLLDETRVDHETVVVRDETKTITYLRDLDYRLVVTGGFYSIEVPTGSRIQPEAVLFVSYRFLAQGTAKTIQQANVGYDAAYSIGPLTLRHGRSKHEGHALEAGGHDGTLGESNYWFAAAFVQSTRIGYVNLEAEERVRTLDDASFHSRELRGSFSPRLPSGWQGTIGAAANFADATAEEANLSSSIMTYNSSVTWRARPSLSMEVGADFWNSQPSFGPGDRYVGGYVGTAWSMGAVDSALRYDRNRRSYAGGANEGRWSLFLTRRF